MAGPRQGDNAVSSRLSPEKAASPNLDHPVLAAAKALPQVPQIWLGTQMRLEVPIEDAPEGVDMAMWMDRATGIILASALGPAGDPGLLRKMFLQAMMDPMAPVPPCRPQAVALESPDLLIQVGDILEALHIDQTSDAGFAMVHEAVQGFLEEMATRLPHPLLTGLTPPEMALFCERMADLWKAAPWRHVGDSELMAVKGLTPDPMYISIMGSMEESFGFVVFLTEDAATTMMNEFDPDMASLPCLVATFEGEDEVGSAWPAMIQEHRWRLGKKGRYPTVMRLGQPDATPSDDEMRLVTSLAHVLTLCPFKKAKPAEFEFSVDDRSGRASWPADPPPPVRKSRPAASKRPARDETAPKSKARVASEVESGSLLQVKISLKGAQPAIWRRVQVSASSSLKELHDVIQAAMGWDESHLWEFEVNGERYGDKRDPAGVRLDTLGLREKSTFRYTYDFGDDWEHSIAVEKVLAPDPGVTYPLCVAGKRAAPPEDCGGIRGYQSLVKAASDPDDDEHEEAVEELGDDFDPAHFDADEVNELLKPAPRKRRRRD